MDLSAIRQRMRRGYYYVGLLILLGVLLTVLQYRWAGEVSEAEGIRLEGALTAGLERVGRDFNRELQADIASLLLAGESDDPIERRQRFVEKVAELRAQHGGQDPFRAYGLIVPAKDDVQLFLLDAKSKQLEPQDWPASWEGLRKATLARLSRGGFGPPPMAFSPTLVEVPNFARAREGPEPSPTPSLQRDPRSPRPPMGAPRGGMGERDWIVVQANPVYYRDVVIPRLLAQHLGANFQAEYNFELRIPEEPGFSTPRIAKPDASVDLFHVDIGDIMRAASTGRSFGPRMGSGRPNAPGRWQLFAQHHAGSVRALVVRSRWRNLAISFAILSLMVVAVLSLFRASRRAEELALMQMNFVAGVSHELRTPLTVIRTAAFNLRGRIAAKPEQVEKYGKLIQEESEKLGAMVEQVLRFASANSGQVIRQRQAVAAAGLIEASLSGSGLALRGDAISVEKSVDPDLPPILADEQAMRHVFQNLIDNALKYGMETSSWLGVSAHLVPAKQDAPACVEFRVADHGPGIPPGEQGKIFDPFFRGERAVSDQIHGTGLGLNLVKQIVEAHQGSIRVESELGKGTVFIVKVPVAPAEMLDEFAHTAG